jgi:hypothetical protein
VGGGFPHYTRQLTQEQLPIEQEDCDWEEVPVNEREEWNLVLLLIFGLARYVILEDIDVQ